MTPLAPPDSDLSDNAGDGRVRRRMENRAAVIEKLRELLMEGAVEPSVEEVAAAAGVSVRSIQRYFGSLDSARDELRSEIIRVAVGHIDRASGPIMNGAPLEERCASLVASRFELYDRIGPMIRVSRSRFHSDEDTAARFDMARVIVDAQVPARFESELALKTAAERAATLAIVNVLLSFESINRLLDQHVEHRSLLGRTLVNQLVTAFDG